jgi:hypothetical protein
VINCFLTVKTKKKKKKKKKKSGDGIRSDERMQNFRVYSFRVEDEMKKDNEKKKGFWIVDERCDWQCWAVL